MLGLEDDIEVVAVATSGTEAVAAAAKHSPDVAVLDLQMPGLDGIEVAERLARELPACGVVIVTSHGRPGYLKRALETGVRGFLPKTVSARVLADVVRQVHAGGRYVDPELAADGAPVEEIAARAALAPGTVRNYLSSAAAKLGVANRHEAARLARAKGWI